MKIGWFSIGRAVSRARLAALAIVIILDGNVVVRGATNDANLPLPLKVVGTRIVNSKGEPVRLQGVNTASMEWTSDGQGTFCKR